MSRSWALLAGVIAFLVVVQGCDGNVDPNSPGVTHGTGGSGGSTPTGGTGGSGGSPATGSDGAFAPDPGDGGVPGSDAANGCLNAVASAGSGHHNPGADCLQCHGSSQMSPNLRWTVAGTLYTDAAGSAPVVGATIEIVDARGTTIRIPTADNGNFWTATNVHFPLQVRASKCPANLVMNSPTLDGSCNGCHVPGSRIHLP